MFTAIKNLSPASFPGMILGAVLTAAVICPVALFIHQNLDDKFRQEERAKTLDKIANFRGIIDHRLATAFSLARTIEAPFSILGDLTSNEFSILSRDILKELNYVRNIALIKDTVIKQVYPRAGSEAILNLDYRDMGERWPFIEEAIQHRKTMLGGPRKLLLGGTGLIQRIPVYQKADGIDGEFLGFVSMVIDTDLLLAPVTRSDLSIGIRSFPKNGSDPHIFWGDETVFNSDQAPIKVNINLPNGYWVMAVVPSEGWGTLHAEKIQWTSTPIILLSMTFILMGGYAGYHQSQRRILYQAVTEERSRYWNLVENAPDPMIILKPSGEIKQANVKACELLKLPRQKLETLAIFDFLAEIQQTTEDMNWPSIIQRLRDDKFAENLEIKTKNGKGEILEIDVSMGLADDGFIEEITATFRDVTEKKQLQFQRNLAEEMLRESIATTPDGFAIFDANDNLFLCNDAYRDMYRFSAPAIVEGASFRDIIKYGIEHGEYPMSGDTPEEQAAWLEDRVHLHRNPTGTTMIHQLGSGRWLKITERRTPSGLTVGVRTDISELKEAEAELRDKKNLLENQTDEFRNLAEQHLIAKNKAEDATKAKTEFLAIISHELRTPMTGILGITDLLLSTAPTKEQSDHLTQLRLSANSLLALLNDILDFSKFEAGKLNLDAHHFNYSLLQRGIEELLEPLTDAKGIELKLDQGNIPEDLILYGDGNRLRQVLLNIASNAVKFTEQGRVEISSELTGETETDAELTIKVTDTGIGITAETIENLFQPFTQADTSTTRRFGGTGLGLSISKRLIEAMQGSISCTSEVGQGSVFTVTLPLPKGDFDTWQENNRPQSMMLTSQANEDRRKLRILLAEDVDVNRMIVSTVLRKWGHEVVEAVNGQEAVDKANTEENYDLILMDMQMPELDGCDATIAIRGLDIANSNTPIIALTADIQADKNERYAKAGMTAFLSKPVDWNQLEKAIEQHCA